MSKNKIDLIKRNEEEVIFDPLDMNNYRVEKFKKINKVGFERYLELFGGPLAILIFLFIYFLADFSFLNKINLDALKTGGADRLKEIGAVKFIKINYAMLGIFAAALFIFSAISDIKA